MKRVLFLCLALAVPSLAAAAVPSPATSTVPCLVVCPLGDIGFQVTVRDIAANPVTGSFVQVRFCPQAGPSPIAFCAPPANCEATGFTNAAGSVTFSIQAGGVTAGAVVNVYADGVLLASRAVASPDQNGDLVVNAVDVGIANGKLGLADATMDLDCDGGVVDAQDLAVQSAHANHNCGPTPAPGHSWGRVKILYR